MAGLITKKRHHGLGNHELWQVYRDMIYRCYRPKGRDYKYYGAKGIKVCDRWLNDQNGIENFIADMSPRPDKTYRLDRIDITKDYSPDNCRWLENIRSVRYKTSPNQKFKLRGVQQTSRNRWEAKITHNGKTIKLGTFRIPEAAARAYDAMAKQLLGDYAVLNYVDK